MGNGGLTRRERRSVSQRTCGNIVVMDDERGLTKARAIFLRRDGYTGDTADHGNRALALLQKASYAIILCSLECPLVGVGVDRRVTPV